MATVTETMVLKKGATGEITRFDVHQMIQHGGLALTFILLVITGLPMKFSSWGISQWWAAVWGGIDNLRTVHHFAAYTIVAFCLYHIIYIAYSVFVLKRPFPIKMIPSIQDFVKLFKELKYFLGLSKKRPKYDRFNWREKFDYWAIFWGMPVMAGSGFILMFPVVATKFLPGWIVPAALVAHSDEAMLALTWIFMVHIFFNHFVPGIFPINTSIFTGKVSKERYCTDHPLEYERLVKASAVEQEIETPAQDA